MLDVSSRRGAAERAFRVPLTRRLGSLARVFTVGAAPGRAGHPGLGDIAPAQDT